MSQRTSVTSANEGSSSQLKSSPSPSHTSTIMSMSSASPTSSSSKNDMSSSDAAEFEQPKPITCRWDDCGKIFYDPEDVYKHLCDDHVGRKSTNNLCLTCKWEGCDVSCAKRDHITSHVRVHTPLKPHNCDVCGKTFKRPQDLKKHERIHTEQHQQQRQQKAAQSAAARTYSKNDHLAYNGYPYPSVHDTSLLAGHEGYYNNIPYGVPQTSGLYPSPSPANGPSYTRDHYAHSVSSSASLSPMSSRLETPQGSSPPGRQENGSYMHFTSSLDGQGKMTTDNNSYTYLAQGAHASQHMAGNKRSHEQVEDFFGDLRCKKMAPAYNANMAERLDSVFGTEGLNDLSLQSIFTGYGQAPQHAQPSTTFSSQLAARQEPADLAQLNSFLLQLGASAARDLGSFSSSSSGSDYQTLPEFDIASLTQEGLHTISGFNESIWSHPMPSTHASQRPIAHLPTRVTKADDGAGYYPYVQSSFDSISMPRGNGVVPQLAPMDAGGHSFRRVDALTRAAPEETLPETDGDDEMNTVKTNGAPRYTDRYRSVSPAGSSESETAESVRRGSTPTSHSLYPRVSPQATARWVQGARDTDTTRPVSHVRKDSDLTDASSSSSLYPSLVDRVSKLDGLGGPVRSSSESAPAVSDATRREHIRLIRDLLIAINFPARAQAERASREGIRLAPILTKIEKKGAVEKDETTPVSRLRNAEFLSEVESDRASTPTPPGRPTLPTLSQLLNDIPEANRSSRPMTDRDMECDV